MLTIGTKCDEQRPVCKNCKRRYIDITCCVYDAKTSKSSKRSVDSPRSSTSSYATTRIPTPVSFKPFETNDSNRVLELRLLYHYTSTTCAGQSLKQMVPLLCHPMWEVNIPQVAFSSPMVLDALLGISAIHLLALQPEDHSLALASRAYFNRAVANQRNALSRLDAESAQPLLVTAVLIAHHTWLSTHITERLDKQYNLTLSTYQMCLGISALIRRASPWLEQYSWSPESSQSCIDDVVKSRGFMRRALEDLNSLSVYFRRQDTPAEDSLAYEKTVVELVAIYSLLMAEPLDVTRIEQDIVTILHRVTPRFLKLLEGEDPIAMALLARNLSLLSILEGSKSWWIHGAGKQKVPNKAVLGIRGLMPAEWMWTMTWPVNIVSKEITLDID